MLLIRCRGIKKSYGETEVIKQIQLDIHKGERIGLVGANGTGKTTLANLIFGSLQPEKGSIERAGSMTIGYLLQSTSYSAHAFNDMLLREGIAGQADDFMKLSRDLGLKKVSDWRSERLNGLSGGEKTKLALAQIWSSKPDLLILDEPTNHLDFQGVEWLIRQLQQYEGTALIISHDRYFLDQTVKRIVEIENGQQHDYAGNYSFYRDEKERRRKSQLHEYMIHQKEQQKIEDDIFRLKQWSSEAHRKAGKQGSPLERKQMGLKQFQRAKAKKMDQQVKSRLKRLEKMKSEGVNMPEDDPTIAFQFAAADKRGRRIIEGSNVTKRYGKRTLFQNSSFYVQRGDRLGIVGPNGCGKTTLLRIFRGEEHLTEGKLWISPTAKIAYLSQDVSDLNPDLMMLESLQRLEGVPRRKIQHLLANMRFDESEQLKRISQLSLGERMRVKIAYLILQENDVLLLDEPTNHLDLYSREMLEQTLSEYNGTLIVVSHDRYMLDKLCDKLLIMNNESICRVESDFSQFLEGAAEPQRKTQDIKEQLMVIENRLTIVLGELSKLTPGETQYLTFDEEFKQLLKQKKSLSQKS